MVKLIPSYLPTDKHIHTHRHIFGAVLFLTLNISLILTALSFTRRFSKEQKLSLHTILSTQPALLSHISVLYKIDADNVPVAGFAVIGEILRCSI